MLKFVLKFTNRDNKNMEGYNKVSKPYGDQSVKLQGKINLLLIHR